MNILDLKDKLPIKVKLNKNFTLEESFDINTILTVKSAKIESDDNFGKCWKAWVSAGKEDLIHNIKVAIPDWYNPDSKEYDLSYYETHNPNAIGDYEDVIHVMEEDNCFDLVEGEDRNYAIEFVQYYLKNKSKYLNNESKETIELLFNEFTKQKELDG